MDHDFRGLIDDALDALWRRDPVTATFAGERDRDAFLPRADADAEAQDMRAIDALVARLERCAIPDSSAARIDARHLAAACGLARRPFTRAARYRNPAWYTGEAAFGIIALLLAEPDAERAAALRARLQAVPAFLEDGIAQLRDSPAPAAWKARARTELGALERLVRQGLPLHPAGAAVRAADVDAVVTAGKRFGDALAASPDSDAACGADHLAFIIEHVHGIHETPAAIERRAAAAFAQTLAALETRARALDPARTWREQIAQLDEIGPAGGDVIASYRAWNERALTDARTLLTPAAEFGLTFTMLPAWAQAVAGDLYFLFYRSPAARGAGAGSTYWVTPPTGSPDDIRRAHNTAAVKLVHAVHHGSIGHHTQNARARSAPSRFARIAGTDGAAAIALLAGGTMVEGWACYAEDVLAEIPGFYTAAEELLLLAFELRNIASTLADIRFHTGTSTLDAMGAFYRDQAGFSTARVGAETTRNSIFPGSRLMYWCGTQQIKALRLASPLPPAAFHDELLAFGATPIAWIAEELAR